MNKYIILIALTFAFITCKTKEKTIGKEANEVLTETTDTVFSSKRYRFSDLQNAFNVKDFGAKANGIDDDTQAINKCFEAIKNNKGGIAYFPNGTYVVSRTNIKGKSWCLLGVNNLEIIGEHRDSTRIKLAPKQKNFTRMFVLDNNNNIKIKNITIDGNVLEQTDPEKPNEHLGGIFINQSNDITISQCKIINTGGDGISIRGVDTPSKNILIEHCFFDNNQRNGITLGSGFDHIEIKNCFFGNKIDDSPIDTEPESGICQNVSIHHNKIYTNSILTVGGNKKVTGRNFNIQNNYFHNCSIFIHKADSVVIAKNKLRIDQPVRAAFTCHSNNNRIYIVDNDIKINGKPAFYFVRTRYSKTAPHHIYVKDNNIEVNGENTYAFDIRGANHINIINNTISGNGGKIGIYCFSNFAMSYINIKGNTIKGFEKGIKITPLKDHIIDKINIQNNTFISKGKMKKAVDYKTKNKLIKDISISKNTFSDSLKIPIDK